MSNKWLVVAAGLLACIGNAQAEKTDLLIEQGVPTTMRDGTVLRADIYRPKEPGHYPVLLQRTPYNKAGGTKFGYAAASHGYVVIFQDVRGRYTSEGEWYTFRHESQDGYDTIEWAAALPYSNGKVGMFGGSYVGATQMLAAIAHPPHLAGICPVVTASNYHRNWTYQGGAFEQWFNESWTSGLAQDTLNKQVQNQTNATIASITLPLTSYPLFNGPIDPKLTTLAPYFLDWLAHPTYDSYWKQWAIEEHYSDITVPALHTAAWYDIFQAGSLENYQGLKLHAANEEARRGQHLLVVIGGHSGSGRKIGDVDFGADAAFDGDDVTLAWYDYLFKGVKNQFAGKPVRLFVMGANKWRDEDDWPLKRARSTKYFLHSNSGANSLRGDGTLSLAASSAGETSDHFTYDPAKPVPTTGGPLCCDARHLAPGPRDQRSVEAPDDVLVYTTEPFSKHTEVTGKIALDLYAKSTAVDTDFTAKLVDVWPNGFAQNVTEGILRTAFRNSQEQPELLNPGQVYELHLDLWSTSNVFLPGHRLRLEVSSSNFPRFDRNLNTGGNASTGVEWTSAINSVLHDAEHPSVLIVPIIE
jgi:putative CocE/NonD family hydrolase